MADEPKPKNAIKAGQLLQRYKDRARAEAKARKAAETERDQLKARPSAEALEAEVGRYQAAEKERVYRKEFDKAAVAAGLNPSEKALDAAWQLAKIDQSGEKPDAAKIKTAVESFAGEHDYLKAPAASSTATDKGATPPPLKAGQGSDRGTSAGADMAGKFTYTEANLGDPKWMHANQEKIAEAASRGALQKV